MKTKNYISVLRLIIIVFFSFQPLNAQTWEEIAVPDLNGYNVTKIWSIKGFGDALYFCTDKGLFRTYNNGTTYTNLTSTNNFTQWITNVFVDESNGDIYIGSGDGVFKSSDNGTSWDQTAVQTGEVTGIEKLGPNILVAWQKYDNGPHGGVYYSSDGLLTKQSSSMVDIYMYSLKLFNNTMYVSGRHGVYKSTDNGESFVMSGTGFPQYTDVYNLTVEGSSLFANTQSQPYKSSDNGETWVNPDPSTFGQYCSVYGLESGPGHIFTLLDQSIICNNGISIVMSEDNGITWSSGLFNLPSTFFDLIETNTSGTCFFAYAPHIQKFYRLCYESAEINENDFLAIKILPNPTTGEVTLTGIKEIAKMAIYDIQGKLLKKYAQIINNQNIDISEFSAGLYFLKIQNESGSKTIKVIRE